MGDELDQPEEDSHELLMPFVVAESNGGPYDDEAFSAGFAAGRIDGQLQTLAGAGGTRSATHLVYTELLPQLELIGMRYGYPTMVTAYSEDYGEWAQVTFVAAKETGVDGD